MINIIDCDVLFVFDRFIGRVQKRCHSTPGDYSVLTLVKKIWVKATTSEAINATHLY